MTNSLLFSELSLRNLKLKNRIAVSPMWQYVATKGFPTDWHLMHLGRFADGGAGLVFQEGTNVERRGCGTVGDLGLWNDAFIDPLRRIVDLIKANGAAAGIQLMHAGRKARTALPSAGRGFLERTPDIDDWDEWEPISASAIPIKEGMAKPREMTARDVQDVIDAFVSAAARAAQAGYDVIEVHGAHGYLIHQFLSEATNRRSDRYGGSFENRIRFLIEIIDGIRSVWDDGKPLFVRLSCVDSAGWTMADTIALSQRLATRGVDLIDCSSGGLIGSPIPPGKYLEYGYQVGYASELRRQTGIPTAAVGLIVHAQQAEDIVASESADLVLLGREFIHNPNWPIDAALKLGVDSATANWPARIAFWLDKRADAMPGFTPSTFPYSTP